ncbi:stage V sporulation protein AC [Dehalobacterium formicoaceticum]|uniref:Stage V sporulation protein AC n=1 Tax=Dehalobacterium formicoaceticum TaxID=51515 RepID=A0ABT1Y4M4_9FIRM|nr:stage V sporulation protein AC [Dehalobacterium formicoaceticum]MCR6545832.1 stage V sporulation protein AC [Dehalobacterium formicoaceticum]
MLEDIEQAIQQNKEKEYQTMVHNIKPSPPVLKNAIAAFGVGGFICAFAQGILNILLQMGLTNKDAGTVTLILMILIGAVLTGFGIYDNLGKFAGAGSIIPITGFANSIVASALEWKREGYVFGVTAKMFTVAGPVLVYGTLISVLIGIISLII